ncbi:MAG: glycosyltransferase family 4 protein [Ignavibacteria bacterium]
MHIWLISLFDPTPIDQPIFPRFVSIANEAVQRGYKVTHFTSTFRHNTKEHRFQSSILYKVNESYNVFYIKSMSYKGNRSIKRFVAHTDFANKLINELEKLKKPDVVFISMPPITTINKVSSWCKHNSITVIIDIIDPWPDSFIKDVPENYRKYARFFLRSSYNKLIKSFGNSSAITAISKGYLNWASNFYNKKKKVDYFYLGVDITEIQKFFQSFEGQNIKKDEDVLRLIYAGSLASSYDIPTILKTAQILDSRYPNKTEFVITGNGPQKNIIQKAENELGNVKYLGWVTREELMKQYYLSDLGLIQHKNSFTQTVTYKFFNYLGAGLPILNSLQSEMVEIIEKEEIGFNNKEGDVITLTKNIETFLKNKKVLGEYKNNALNYSRQEGDINTVYRRLVDFLESVAFPVN